MHGLKVRLADLIAIEVHMRTAPGLCMHIVVILKLPTSFRSQVFLICGIYCADESAADDKPRNVVHNRRVESSALMSMKVMKAQRPLIQERRFVYGFKSL